MIDNLLYILIIFSIYIKESSFHFNNRKIRIKNCLLIILQTNCNILIFYFYF